MTKDAVGHVCHGNPGMATPEGHEEDLLWLVNVRDVLLGTMGQDARPL